MTEFDREQYAKVLKARHLPQMPKGVSDLVFTKAWEDGHSEGLDRVEQEYMQLGLIADAAWGAAGYAEVARHQDTEERRQVARRHIPELRGDIDY
jgi:hypothetical protein